MKTTFFLYVVGHISIIFRSADHFSFSLFRFNSQIPGTMVTPSASSTSEPEWGLVNAGGVPPSGGKFQDLLIGDDVILLGSDDGAVGTTFHEITGLWETPSGKRMAAIHRYYTVRVYHYII